MRAAPYNAIAVQVYEARDIEKKDDVRKIPATRYDAIQVYRMRVSVDLCYIEPAAIEL